MILKALRGIKKGGILAGLLAGPGFGGVTPAALQPLLDQVVALRAAGQYDQAREAVRRTISRARELEGPSGRTVAIGLMEEGNILHSLGRYDEAATALRRALQIRQDLAEASSKDRYDAALSLATALHSAGRLAEAKTELLRAKSLSEDIPEFSAAQASHLYYSISQLLYAYSEVDAAKKWADAAVAFLSRADAVTQEKNSRMYRHHLATILVAQKNYQDAAATLRELLEICGGTHPCCYPRMQLARALWNMRRDTEAIEEQRKALAEAKARFGTGADKLAGFFHFMGVVLREEDVEAARENYLHALSLYETRQGPDGKQVRITLVDLGNLWKWHEDPQRVEEARLFYLKARKSAAKESRGEVSDSALVQRLDAKLAAMR